MSAPALPKTGPSPEDIALALASGKALSSALETGTDTPHIDVHDDHGGVRTVPLPATALRLLLEVLTEIGQGNAVAVIPIHTEPTTPEPERQKRPEDTRRRRHEILGQRIKQRILAAARKEERFLA